jgi:alpha-tubulin suppressor-like RCC1 family protein
MPDGTLRQWGSTFGFSSPVPTVGLLGGLPAITQVSVAETSALAVDAGGRLWAWGYNVDGVLGDGSTLHSALPHRVRGVGGAGDLTGIVQASMGFDHALALRFDGTVFAWGRNTSGQLGDGSTTGRTTPVQVPGLTGVTRVVSSFGFSLALRSDGTVWAWGTNVDGELGIGVTDTAAHPVPVQVSGLSGVTQIAAGWRHAMAVAGATATVWAWGDNTHGALGGGIHFFETLPITIGLSNVVQISAGFFTSAAILSDGSLWTWGNDTFVPSSLGRTGRSDAPGQVTVQDPASGATLSLQVAVGAGHSLLIAVNAATVPDLTDLTVAQARQALLASGLVLGQQSVVFSCEAVGRVLRQSPSAGTARPLGSAVNVTIGSRNGRPCP